MVNENKGFNLGIDRKFIEGLSNLENEDLRKESLECLLDLKSSANDYVNYFSSKKDYHKKSIKKGWSALILGGSLTTVSASGTAMYINKALQAKNINSTNIKETIDQFRGVVDKGLYEAVKLIHKVPNDFAQYIKSEIISNYSVGVGLTGSLALFAGIITAGSIYYIKTLNDEQKEIIREVKSDLTAFQEIFNTYLSKGKEILIDNNTKEDLILDIKKDSEEIKSYIDKKKIPSKLYVKIYSSRILTSDNNYI